MSDAKVMRVAEVFGPTLQGEGERVGLPTYFVRFGGCDFRCSWCDSLHAVLPENRFRWEKMTATEILNLLEGLGARAGDWITLSGGNPALQDLRQLIDLGHMDGLRFAMETQGTAAKPWMGLLDHLTISPKPPSAGQVTVFADLDEVMAVAPASVEMKVVVFDDADFGYALSVFRRFPDVPHVLSVGNTDVSPTDDLMALRHRLLDDYERLAQRVLSLGLNARVLPQLHALAWGNKQGV